MTVPTACTSEQSWTALEKTRNPVNMLPKTPHHKRDKKLHTVQLWSWRSKCRNMDSAKGWCGYRQQPVPALPVGIDFHHHRCNTSPVLSSPEYHSARSRSERCTSTARDHLCTGLQLLHRHRCNTSPVLSSPAWHSARSRSETCTSTSGDHRGPGTVGCPSDQRADAHGPESACQICKALQRCRRRSAERTAMSQQGAISVRRRSAEALEL
eukprot:UN0442